MATYKEHFGNANEAAGYDAVEYASGSYSALLWSLEQILLEQIIADFRASHPRIEYLDFAAGTGRVLSFCEPRVDSATGMEISEAMAARARERVSRATVLCRDITGSGAAVEGQYDLITAFRFFLNAEPALRVAGMKALAGRLRDKTSRLVFNNHGNLWSIKLLAWPYHRLRGLGKGWRPYGNYMTDAEIQKLTREAGLRIVKRIGYGMLGGTIAGRMSYDRAMRLERRLPAQKMFQRLAQNQLYVVCRK